MTHVTCLNGSQRTKDQESLFGDDCSGGGSGGFAAYQCTHYPSILMIMNCRRPIGRLLADLTSENCTKLAPQRAHIVRCQKGIPHPIFLPRPHHSQKILMKNWTATQDSSPFACWQKRSWWIQYIVIPLFQTTVSISAGEKGILSSRTLSNHQRQIVICFATPPSFEKYSIREISSNIARYNDFFCTWFLNWEEKVIRPDLDTFPSNQWSQLTIQTPLLADSYSIF